MSGDDDPAAFTPLVRYRTAYDLTYDLADVAGIHIGLGHRLMLLR